MSSDLLAEFDSFYQAPSEASHADSPKSGAERAQSLSFLDDLSSLDRVRSEAQSAAKGVTADPEAEDWGAFESFGEMKTNSSPEPLQGPRRSDQETIWNDLGAFEPTESPSQLHHKLASSNVILSSQQGQQTRRSVQAFGRDSNVDVLFDAEAPDLGDDDFGDFESVNAETLNKFSHAPESELWPKQARANATNNDFDSLARITGSLSFAEAPEASSVEERNPFAELLVSTESPEKPRQRHETGTPITAWPSFVPLKPEIRKPQPAPEALTNDDWGGLTDSPALPAVATQISNEARDQEWEFLPPRTTDMPLKLPPKSAPTTEPQVLLPTTRPPSDPPTLSPPTNIPPPSMLLSLFPPLFNLPQSTLFTPISTQPPPLKDRILSDPSAITFLRGYLLLATVCARLIAGRRLRWKRDTHLSQSMKIGSAQNSKLSGMKLTSVDKAENMKEEREVADVVKVWKEQLGKLRSAVVVANSSGVGPPLGTIPDVAEALPIRMAKAAEGAVVAERACVLCGLKREERVEKVDVGVEDTFGEWWTEYWGHTACSNFWEEHKDELRQN